MRGSIARFCDKDKYAFLNLRLKKLQSTSGLHYARVTIVL